MKICKNILFFLLRSGEVLWKEENADSQMSSGFLNNRKETEHFVWFESILQTTQ